MLKAGGAGMGWLYYRIKHSAKEELRRQVEDQQYAVPKAGVDPYGPEAEWGPSPFRLLDVAIVAMQEAYMAVLDTRDGKVRAWTFLVNLREGKDGFNFGYKDMTEASLPYFFRCPKRILDRLSALEECYEAGSSRDYAGQWREACRAVLGGKAKAKALKSGDRVRFAEPLRFADGVVRDEFEVVVRPGRRGRGQVVRFLAADGASCRISGFRTREFALVS